MDKHFSNHDSFKEIGIGIGIGIGKYGGVASQMG